MVHVDVGVHVPVPPAQDVQLLQDGNHGGVEVEGYPFAEQIEPDNLHIMWFPQRASPTERCGVDRFLCRRNGAGLGTVEEAVLLHPADQLIRMIRFLEGMLRKDRLVALVAAKRVTQAECLREFARLVDELMHPLQIVRLIGARKRREKWALANLRSVLLRIS